MAYCMTAEQTLANRRAAARAGTRWRPTRGWSRSTSRPGAADVLRAGPGVKFNPSFVGDDGRLHPQGRAEPAPASTTPSGTHGTEGRHPRRVVVARRHARRVSQTAHGAAADLAEDVQPATRSIELTLTGILPSFSPAGDRVRHDRPAADPARPRRQHRGRRHRHRTRPR